MNASRALDGRMPPASDGGGPRYRKDIPHRLESRQVVMIRVLRAMLMALLLMPMAALTAALPIAAQEVIAPGPTTELSVDTDTGIWPFQVELADDPHERAQGLMYRRKMQPDHGMLFDMGEVRPVGFWMKNTFLPLDIIFIGSDGRVRSMALKTEPLSEAVIESGEPVRFVLELNAGTAKRIGLKAGDHVRHEVIGPGGE